MTGTIFQFMRSPALALALLIICAGPLLAFSLSDKTDPYPLGPILSGSVDHGHLPIVLKLTVDNVGPSHRILADILIYNNTDQTLDYLCCKDLYLDFKFEITDGLGNPIKPSVRYADFLKQRHENGSTEWPLSPGESQHFYLTLSKEYDFLASKIYHMKVSKVVALEAAPDEPPVHWKKLTSDVVKLSVP